MLSGFTEKALKNILKNVLPYQRGLIKRVAKTGPEEGKKK